MESEDLSPEQPVAREEPAEGGSEGRGTEGGTTPPDPTHEATTPPSNPEPDEDAVRDGGEDLDRAGGGH